MEVWHTKKESWRVLSSNKIRNSRRKEGGRLVYPSGKVYIADVIQACRVYEEVYSVCNCGNAYYVVWM